MYVTLTWSLINVFFCLLFYVLPARGRKIESQVIETRFRKIESQVIETRGRKIESKVIETRGQNYSVQAKLQAKLFLNGLND